QSALHWLDAWRVDDYARTDTNKDGLEDHPGLSVFELDNIDYDPPYAGFESPLGDALINAIYGPYAGAHVPGEYNGQLSTVYDALTGRTPYRLIANPDALIRTAVSNVLTALANQYKTPDIAP